MKWACNIQNGLKKQEQKGNSQSVLGSRLTFKANAHIPLSSQGKGRAACEGPEGGSLRGGGGQVTPGRRWAQKSQVWEQGRAG